MGNQRPQPPYRKKLMLACAFVIAVNFIMKNHTYRFNRKVKKQIEGGLIGLKITGIIAKIVMLWFDKKTLKSLRAMKIELLLYKRYVDDSNLVLKQ